MVKSCSMTQVSFLVSRFLVSVIFRAEDPIVEDGYVSSLLFVTAQPSDRMLNVKCVASNYVGYVEDLSQEFVTCKL